MSLLSKFKTAEEYLKSFDTKDKHFQKLFHKNYSLRCAISAAAGDTTSSYGFQITDAKLC